MEIRLRLNGFLQQLCKGLTGVPETLDAHFKIEEDENLLWLAITLPDGRTDMASFDLRAVRAMTMDSFSATPTSMVKEFLADALGALRRQRQAISAVDKAEGTFRQFLTPQQQADFLRHTYIMVRGGSSGRTYRIKYAQHSNITLMSPDGTRAVRDICFVPQETGLPIYDIMLMQKLCLENDEVATLAIANDQGPALDAAERPSLDDYVQWRAEQLSTEAEHWR